MTKEDHIELYEQITRTIEASDELYHLWQMAWRDKVESTDPPSCVKYKERREQLVRLMIKLKPEDVEVE